MVKVECEGCQSPYQIDERRIPPTGLKMRCPKCGTSVLVQRPGGALPAAGSAVAPPAAPPATPAPPRLQPPGAPPAAPYPPPAAPMAPPRATPPPATPAAAVAKSRGGFGELDLMVDLPNPGDAEPASDGGIGLPEVGRSPAPFGGFGGGGSGEIEEPAYSGGVDLPAVGRGSPTFSSGSAGFGGGFGEIDLPAAAERAPAGPFGAVDLPAVGSAPQQPWGAPEIAPASSGIDLPAPVARSASPFGSVELPVVGGGGGMEDFGSVDLPAPAARQASPFGPGQGMGHAFPQTQQAPGLPKVSHAGLPAVGGGLPLTAAGLPGYGGQSAGLPAVAAGYPAVAQAGYPALGQGAGYPAVAQAGFPAVGQGAGYPAVGQAGFPAVGGPGLPSHAGAGLPMHGSPGLPYPGGSLPMPVVGGGLPIAAGGSLPSPGGAGYPMAAGGSALPSPMGHGALPSAAGAAGFPMNAYGGGGLPTAATSGGLPTPAPSGVDPFGNRDPFGGGHEYARDGQGAGGEFDDFGGQPPAPVSDDGSGEFDPMAGAAQFGAGGGIGSGGIGSGGLGNEFDLEGGPLPGAGPSGAPIPVARPGARDSSELPAPRKKSMAPKMIGAAVVVIAMGGALLGLSPKMGMFGYYAISDSAKGGSNIAALADLRKNSQAQLDNDSAADAVKAIAAGKSAIANAPRHAETSAYGAYLMYAKVVRFGPDGPSEAAGAAILDPIPAETTNETLVLARAARDATSGQLARAKQTVAPLAAKDVDAAVLLGEIELVGKSDKAIAAWDKAVALRKSPRTQFGLARAQFKASNTTDAEATAKAVLEAQPKHVGARNLLARIALRDPARDAEVIGLVTKVVDDKEVRGGASDAELVESFTLMGLVHLDRSRMSQAEAAFGEALKLNQQAVEALIGNGELYYRQGRFSNAQARFEAASRADADSLIARIGIAKSFIALERAKEAKDLLQKLKESHAKEPRVTHWLGKSEESLGNRKAAQALYEEAIQLGAKDPIAVDSYVSLSALLASQGRTEEAAKKLDEASAQFPELPALFRARGDVALASGRYEKAKQEYEAALKKGEDLGTRFQLGVTFRRMRLFDEAVAVFDQVAAADKDFPGLALERGLYYEETGQSDQALAMYGEALRKAPNDIDLKLRVASTQVAAGHPEKGEQALREVLKERPSSAEANHFLGRALLGKGENLGEAMSSLQKAVQFDPNRAEYQLYVAIAANEAGQPGRAEKAIDRALELDSEMGDAYWQRGVLKQKQGATRDAILDLLKGLDKRPSRFEAYATLGLCYEDQNDLASAENAWKRAILGNPKVPEWHYRLGRLYQKRGDKPNTILALTKAAEGGAARNPRPGWLSDAYRLLGEAYDGADNAKALDNYRRFLDIAPANNAYRTDAEEKIKTLAPR